MSGDPVAGDELGEEPSVELAATAIIDVLGRCLMAQLGEAQARGELAIVPEAPFPVEQQGEPFRVREALRLGVDGEFAERPGHAGEAHGVEAIEGGMVQHSGLLQW